MKKILLPLAKCATTVWSQNDSVSFPDVSVDELDGLPYHVWLGRAQATLGYTNARMARLARCSERTWQRYVAGERRLYCDVRDRVAIELRRRGLETPSETMRAAKVAV